jgi:hypothetical protein
MSWSASAAWWDALAELPAGTDALSRSGALQGFCAEYRDSASALSIPAWPASASPASAMLQQKADAVQRQSSE